MFKDDHAPRGLVMLHSTQTVAEAELLRQVLHQAGFPTQHVPSAGAGVFGTTGNNTIYISEELLPEARAFLEEYLAAEPHWDEGEIDGSGDAR